MKCSRLGNSERISYSVCLESDILDKEAACGKDLQAEGLSAESQHRPSHPTAGDGATLAFATDPVEGWPLTHPSISGINPLERLCPRDSVTCPVR